MAADLDQSSSDEDLRRSFEAAWNRGDSISALEAVKDLTVVEKRRLVPLLLDVELHHRKQRGLPLSADEYLSAFPHEAEQIKSVIARHADTVPLADGATMSVADVPDAYVHRGLVAAAETDKPEYTTESLADGSSDPVDSGEAGTESFDSDPAGTTGKDKPGSKPSQARSVNRLRFQPLREHAHGGLGKVYLARDTELNREVALKEILPKHSTNKAARSRFVLEAEVTGGLEHPGIVPIYGLGTYADGRPYYAMRFIRGESLKDAIDRYHKQETADAGERAVALRQLLTHFIDVCQAIDYAHSRGVLHRDIKPANIMLGKFGETLVVDWGLAKAQGVKEITGFGEETALQPASGSQVDATQAGSAMGTLQYMSPEQAHGNLEVLGPQTDVFSLGATLYELLTGKMPYQSVPRDQLMERVKKGEFPEPRTISSRISKPLNAICLKAMAADLTVRYAKAGGLIADLEKYLADEPISAYEETPWEKTQRFVRRHRQYFVAGVGSLAVVALVASFAAFFINQARQQAVAAKNLEEKAKGEATRNYATAREAVDKWFAGAIDALKYYPNSKEMRTRLLEAARTDYKQFSQLKSDDPKLEFERGLSLLHLGDIHSQLGDPKSALEAWREAEKIFTEKASGDQASKQAFVRETISSLERQGMAHFQLGDGNQALTVFAAGEKLLPELGDPKQWHPKTIATKANLFLQRAAVELELGRVPDASVSVATALGIADRIPKDGKLELSAEEIRLTAYQMHGRLLAEAGELQKAAAAFETAANRANSFTGLDPGEQVKVNDWLARLEVERGNALRQAGQWDKGLAAYSSAEKYYDVLHDAIPDAPLFLEMRGLTLHDLGVLHWNLENLDACQRDVTSALAHFRRLANGDEEQVRYRDEFVASAELLSRVQRDRGETKQAAELLQSVLVAAEQLVDEVPDFAAFRQRRAVTKYRLAQLTEDKKEAEALFEAAVAESRDLVKKVPGDALFQQSLAHVLWQYGWWLKEHGDADRVEAVLAESQTAWERAMELAPTPDVQNEYARFLLDLPAPVKDSNSLAKTLAGKAVTDAPENVEYQWTLGWAACQASDEEFAKWQQDHSLPKAGPDSDGIRFALLEAFSEFRQGKTNEAGKRWTDAEAKRLELRPGSPELRRFARQVQQKVK